MKHAGLNMGQVKKQNRSSILNYICEVGPVSRKDIAEVTGLTPAAVTQICNDFIKQGLLFETGQTTESQGAGRKKVLVDINYDYAYIFAVNIEQEQTTVALSNMNGQVREIENLATKSKKTPEDFLLQVAEVCRNMLEKHTSCKDKVAGVSVAITGIVDKEKGSSVHAYGIWQEEVFVCDILEKELGYPVVIENNVNAFAIAELIYGFGKEYDNLLVIKWGPGVGSTIIIDNKVYEGRNGKAAELGHFIVVHAYGIWQEEVFVCDILEKELGYPVVIENNVNAFAIAELIYGFGKEYDNLLVIKWGPGVGSTIIIDNKVYEGRNGKAAELGHFIVERDGNLCNCGRRGCLETKVSYQAMAERKNFDQKEFGKAYRLAKEQQDTKIFDEAIDLFARTIVNSITILAPNRVVLCGRLFQDKEIRQLLIGNCVKYDSEYSEKRIIYSALAEKEDYIGPVAAFVQSEIF